MFADDGSSKKSESSYIVSLFDDLSLVKIVQFKKNLAVSLSTFSMVLPSLGSRLLQSLSTKINCEITPNLV